MDQLHVVTYIDLAAKSVEPALAALKRYRTAVRGEAGNTATTLFQEIGRPDRLAVIETWADQKALDAHAAAASTSTLAADLKPHLVAPVDSRAHTSYQVGARSTGSAEAIYVHTHVDVPPPQLPALEPMLKEWGEASRKAQGAIWLDILQSPARKNHFTTVEGWSTRAAFDAQALSPHARLFREKLAPMLGALYDQRLFRIVE